MIQGVVFDLDDTLYLERDYVRSGFKAVDYYLRAQGKTGFFEKAWGYYGAGGRGDTFNVVLKQMSVAVDRRLIVQLVSAYRKHQPEISLLPDAEEVLNEFLGRYQLGLITDGYAISQKSKIDALGLRSFMDHIVVTDELGQDREFWKPHVKPYEVIKKYFALAHSECVYVGDNPVKDFVTPKQLGWLTVQVNRPGSEYENAITEERFRADYEVDSLKKLPDLIFQNGKNGE